MRGNVLIRGWGAAQLLRDVPHVLCVRICAPMPHRIKEMKHRLGVDDNEIVGREIERNDEAHARSVQRQFRTEWQDATGYDIVINTAHVEIEPATAVLQQLAKSGQYDATDASRSILFDKLIEMRVRSTLDEMILGSPIGISLGVNVRNGHVAIDGVVSADTTFRNALKEFGKIDGVNTVVDNTVSVPMGYGV